MNFPGGKRKMGYRILEHTADLKIEAFGKTEEELFSSIGLGVGEAMAGEKIKNLKKKLKNQKKIFRQIKVEGEDLASLLINFLNELIFLSEKYGEIYLEYKIEIKDRELKASIFGIAKPIVLEVKAATWHNFVLKKEDGKLKTIVVFDI